MSPAPFPCTVSSVPSANWVMIMPDVTVMELARSGTDSDCDSVSATTVDTINTVPTSPDPTDDDTPFLNSTLHLPSNSFPKQARSKSSASATSAESSVDMESSLSDNWNIHSLLLKAQRLFSISGLRDTMNQGSVQDTAGEIPEAIAEGEDDIVRTEPSREHDSRFVEYPFHSQEGLTMTHKDQLNSELKDRFATSLCVRGSNLTPEPITSASPQKTSVEPSHKRMATWHNESQFSTKSPIKNKRQVKQLQKLTPYVSTPRMRANLRVQPHPLKGLRLVLSSAQSEPSNKSLDRLWSQRRVFDVFVHPSTLPEVYHYMQKKSTSGSFLVEMAPIPQLNRYVPKTSETGSIKPDSTSADGNEDGTAQGGVSSSPEGGLPASLVVRLCFATRVTVRGDEMLASVSETSYQQHQEEMVVPGVSRGLSVAEEGERVEPRVSVSVRVGQVLMSDLARQQLEIRECSRVKILHVVDSWRMSFVDGIKVVLQPMNYNKVHFA